jgi:hypothetical protein
MLFSFEFLQLIFRCCVNQEEDLKAEKHERTDEVYH